MSLAPGITKAGDGLDNIAWNILGQTYVPKAVSEGLFAWHATLPPDTFVPPHIHPTQDEFIYMFEGQFELIKWVAQLQPVPKPPKDGGVLRLRRKKAVPNIDASAPQGQVSQR